MKELQSKDKLIRRKRRTKHIIAAMTIVLTSFGLGVLLVYTFSNKTQIDSTISNFQESALPSSIKSERITSMKHQKSSSEILYSENFCQPSDWKLLLVNPEIPMPQNYKVNVVESFDVEMDSRIVQPFTDMYKAAKKDGINLWVSSAYRSVKTQTRLLKEEVLSNLRHGMQSETAYEKAEMAVAKPGYSEHNTGLAVDLNGVRPDFDKTPAFRWLQKHAQEYGFILRYPQNKENITHIMYEPWHYRYVGVENAKEMNKRHMCLEEYIVYLYNNSSEKIFSKIKSVE